MDKIIQGGIIMAHIRILSPTVEEYIIVVSIPLKSPTILIKNQTINEAEESFISRRNTTSDHTKRIEFDIIAQLLKWANCCNANLVEMHNVDYKLNITLSFSTINDMMRFNENMGVNVRSTVK